MPSNKEIHFFDNESVFQNSLINYSLYHQHFYPKPWHIISGEATPIYMYWYAAPQRIYDYNPSLKLIVLLRNPIERAYSHWNMERARGAEQLSFWEAINNESERCREALPFQHRVYSYVDRGYYLQQLRRLWTYFPRQQVLVIKTESFKQSPQSTLNTVFQFLEISPIRIVHTIPKHTYPYPRPMSQREKQFLLYKYEYEIRALERELGWDCNDWLQ